MARFRIPPEQAPVSVVFCLGAIALFRRAVLSRAPIPSRDAAICIVRAFAIVRDNAFSATAVVRDTSHFRDACLHRDTRVYKAPNLRDSSSRATAVRGGTPC